MVPLKNEIKLMNSYRYLLQIRYKKNLIFKIEIDDRFLNEFQLPVLSLQPLAENAVKHNVISNDKPLTIHIYTLANNAIVIENKIQTKLEGPKSSEIGLENLNNRFKLLTGKEIEIKKENMMFSVTLPLMKIEKKNESNNH